MASIQAKKGKKGITYYIVYAHLEHNRNCASKRKKKWLKAGKSKVAAESMLREFKKAYHNNKDIFNAIEPIKFSDFIFNDFLPWCEARKSRKCLAATKYSLSKIIEFFGNINLHDINIQLIEKYITYRKKPNLENKILSNRTVNLDLTYLSQCLKKAKDWKLIDDNPCNDVPKLKIDKGRIRFFTPDEIKLLLENANPYIERFLVVGLTTGMRMGEMLNLKLSNINLANNVIHILNDSNFQTKSRKNRDIPISQLLLAKLENYINYWVHIDGKTILPRTQAQRVFMFCNSKGQPLQSFRKAYINFMYKLGIKDTVIHTMRHTYASYLIMNGASIRTVQELLGHSSISMTEIYTHLTNNHKQESVKLLDFGKEV